MKIGITGTIGAGKTSVSNYLKDKGYPVFDADEFVHTLYKQDTDIYIWLVEVFGKQILNEDKSVDRKRLAKLLFEHKNYLNELEAKIFPHVRDAINIFSSKHAASEKNVFFEVPLLFESNMADIFDIIWVVDATETLRLSRLLSRGISNDDARNRIAHQMSSNEKRDRADAIIENELGIPQLHQQVDSLLDELIS